MSPFMVRADEDAEARGACLHCGGDGWLWDSTDSGSGAQVYCDCAAGAQLRERDLFTPLHDARPSSGDADGGGR